MPAEPIELFVRRHSHVLLHVVSLIARRGFHLAELVCEPTDDFRLSRIRLRVECDDRRGQLVKELARLHDVLRIGRATLPV